MLNLAKSWWNTAVYLVPHQDVVYVTSRVGRVLRVPARILVADPSYRVIAYGAQAREVEYAGMEKSRVISPFTPSEIADEGAARLLLRAIIWEVLGTRFLLKPSIHLTLPPQTTPFMRELWQRALYGAGARRVQAWHPALVAAAAADLPIASPQGFAIGWITSTELTLCLVAFGQVQREVTRVRRWQAPGVVPSEMGSLWQDFLRTIPVEFVPALKATGVLLVAEETPHGQARAWSKAIGVPVTFLPWANLPLGLRSLNESAGEPV